MQIPWIKAPSSISKAVVDGSKDKAGQPGGVDQMQQDCGIGPAQYLVGFRMFQMPADDACGVSFLCV